MPLDAVNFYPKGPVKSSDLRQFYDLATGVMTDQPVTYRNTLSIGGNQGLTTVPLKIYGAVGQNSNLIDLYTDRTAPQPGFGFNAIGSFAWGPGGAAAQDTFLSRLGTQHGVAGDTAGLLISPRLDVVGPTTLDGAVTITSNLTLTTGTLTLTRLNFNANAFIRAWATDATYVEVPKLMVTPGNTTLASLIVSGATQLNSTLGVAGAATLSSTLNVTGAAVLASTLQVNSTLNAYGGRINFEGSNAVYIQWRGDLGALYVPYGNGIYTSGITDTGGMTVNGRFVQGGYDAGWNFNVASNPITNGRWYQRANAGAWCYDALDFTYGVGIAANTLVQRDGSGNLSDPRTTGQAAIGGASFTLPNVSGNAGMWRFIKAWGQNLIIYLTNGTFILENTQYGSGQYTLKMGDSVSCYCDGGNWWVM